MTPRPQYAPALLVALAASVSVGSPAGPASAQDPQTLQQIEYEACMRLTRTDPEEAFERSLAWQDMGGGLPARHCGAVALMLLGHHAEAASRFEEAARQMPDDAPPEAVADMMAHAGIAWMEAGETARALDAQTAALALFPDAPEILVDRALVLGQEKRYWEAIDDLNAALAIFPDDPAALSMRASAYRYVDVPDLAMEDATRALEIDSTHPEALLERGILHRLAGNPDAARQDWITLIEYHDGRPAADHARRNLELLDVKTTE
jgi:tetratricopeptide (TPR) repeat protein